MATKLTRVEFDDATLVAAGREIVHDVTAENRSPHPQDHRGEAALGRDGPESISTMPVVRGQR
jgi:hypothetical protein